MVGPGNDAWYGKNGAYHPDGNYKPGVDTHNGPNGAYHPNGYFGPDGGWHEDKPGTNPHDQPNGGNNGNHGLIGGNGGVEHGAADYGDHGVTGNQANQQRNLPADRGAERPGEQNPRTDQHSDANQRNTGADRDHTSAGQPAALLHERQRRSRPGGSRPRKGQHASGGRAALAASTRQRSA